jgi:hypothetical protein
MSNPPPPAFDEEFDNPYAAPKAAPKAPGLEPGVDLARAEEIRRTYLKHEASVRSIGTLFLLFAILITFGLALLLLMALGARPQEPRPDVPESRLVLGISVVVLLPFLAIYYALGIGLRRLQTWSRWATVVLMILAMALGAFALVIQSQLPADAGRRPDFSWVGWIINVYILYLLLSAKGTMVFSPEYKAVIAQTPHIKYRTSRLVRILVAVFVALLVLAVVAASIDFLSSRR